MKDTDNTVIFTMHQKPDATHTPPNQNISPLDNSKPANVKTDVELVALLSYLWHHSRDQSAKMREIIESNVNPEEAEIAQKLFSAMPPELHNELQKQTALHLDSLRDDELGQYVPTLLNELRAGRLLTMSTSSAPYYIRVYPASFPYPETTVSPRPCKLVIDINECRAQLQRSLEDDRYAGQHRNIRKAFSLYDEGYVPNVKYVFIQMGKVAFY